MRVMETKGWSSGFLIDRDRQVDLDQQFAMNDEARVFFTWLFGGTTREMVLSTASLSHGGRTVIDMRPKVTILRGVWGAKGDVSG